MMALRIFVTAVLALVYLAAPTAVWPLSSEAIVRLKSAGVGDATIELMIAERSVETAAFTVDEILAMKKAGIGEKTLQAVVRAGSFLQGTEPIVYGRAIRPLRLSGVDDIIEMHRAGFSDELLEAVIMAVSSGVDDDRRRALRLLESMHIRVDLRDK